MVTLKKEELTIVIKDINAAERWVDTVDELLDLLSCKGENFTQSHPNVLLLLREIMPTAGQAEAMYGIKSETSH